MRRHFALITVLLAIAAAVGGAGTGTKPGPPWGCPPTDVAAEAGCG